MKRLQPPTTDYNDVFNACINWDRDPTIQAKYSHAQIDINEHASLYQQRAMEHTLFEFHACTWGNDNQILLSQLTKSELNSLYKKGMVKTEGGRKFYDQLINSTPHGKCPYCHFGHVETLDHFLPKAYYPTLAIVPHNLVPACMSCNKGKASEVVTLENQISHPYFEDPRIEQDVWLKAEITETNPVTSRFFVECPHNWPPQLITRITKYFDDFSLSRRYGVEAASELVSISNYLRALQTTESRVNHLNIVATTEQNIFRNNWKSALYNALIISNWYVEIGYLGDG